MEAAHDSTRDEDGDIDAIFKGVLRCEPVITHDLLLDLDRWASAASTGVTRRIGLSVASKNGDWFRELSESTDMAATMALSLRPIESQAEALRQLADILTTAHTRMMVALCNHIEFDVNTQTMRPLHQAA